MPFVMVVNTIQTEVPLGERPKDCPATVEPKDETAPQNEAPTEPQVEESGDF